ARHREETGPGDAPIRRRARRVAQVSVVEGFGERQPFVVGHGNVRAGDADERGRDGANEYTPPLRNRSELAGSMGILHMVHLQGLKRSVPSRSRGPGAASVVVIPRLAMSGSPRSPVIESFFPDTRVRFSICLRQPERPMQFPCHAFSGALGCLSRAYVDSGIWKCAFDS